MLKKAIAVALIACILAGGGFLAFNTALTRASSSVLSVPQDYPTIQEAINAANPGDTILVEEGTYPEYLIVDRSVSLVGQNKTTTIINGSIIIFESFVNVRGFTIRNGNSSGIIVWESSNVIISGNIVLNHTYVGISLSGVNSSIIGANTIASNNLTGFDMNDSYNNTIFGNLIDHNRKQNVALVWSSNNTIIGNRINSSLIGIIMNGNSLNNTLVGNTVLKNSKGIYLDSFDGVLPRNNTFYHNSLINNTNQVVNSTATVNKWDNGYPSGGNYWSDHTEVDSYSGPYQNVTGSDGIEDTQYKIDADNRDAYPLLVAWVDVSAPTTTDNYDGLWHPADFTIALTADDEEIGVAETYYKINDGLAKSVRADAQPLILMEGTNKLEYWSIDWAGNEESPHKILTNIKMDRTNPSFSLTWPENGSEVTSPNVTVTWEGSDVVSGIDHYEVRIDSSSWISKGTNTTHTFFDVGDGSHRIEVKAFDKSGRTQTAFVNFAVRTSPTGGWEYTQTAILAVAFIAVGLGLFYYFRKAKHQKLSHLVIKRLFLEHGFNLRKHI